MKSTASKYHKAGKKAKGLLSLSLALLLIPLVSCGSKRSVHLLSRFGSYGANAALKIAASWPRREAGSEAEKQTGDYIYNEFKKIGFVPETQTVPLGGGKSSRNIIVRIPGFGFTANPDVIEQYDYDVYKYRAKAEDGLFRRQVIVGARYDSDPLAEEGADGISDNASGVGALLQLARHLKREQMGFDVILVAFGGGFSGSAGAKTYVGSMSERDIQITNCFYEFRSLYAGEKLYANAGWSSTYPGQKYILRQPAYEIADIALGEPLYTIAGETLYQNQSTYKISNPLLDENEREGYAAPEIVFREISRFPSDYRAFDRFMIPCVFFESYDYSADNYADLKENVDPNFASSEYRIRGTAFDNISVLKEYSDANTLEHRINTAAFLVYRAIEEGVMGGTNHTP